MAVLQLPPSLPYLPDDHFDGHHGYSSITCTTTMVPEETLLRPPCLLKCHVTDYLYDCLIYGTTTTRKKHQFYLQNKNIMDFIDNSKICIWLNEFSGSNLHFLQATEYEVKYPKINKERVTVYAFTHTHAHVPLDYVCTSRTSNERTLGKKLFH